MTVTAQSLNVLINGKSLIEATLNFDVERIDVTTSHEPDPGWRFVDAAWHMHAWSKDGALPTLKAVQKEIVCTDPDHDDGCEGYWLTEYFCRICDVKVTPKMRETTAPKFKPGPISWRIDFRARASDMFELSRYNCSVWATDGEKLVYFGIGQIGRITGDMQGIMSGSVVGIGELGKR